VSTDSTKSRRRKQKRVAETAAAKTKATEPIALNVARSDVSERSWLIANVAILLGGAFLRLYDLKLVPLHHDEGVNGNFLVRLVHDGFYHYDPANYHGPTLYYFSAIIPWILRFLFGSSAQNAYGLNTTTIRLVPALFGVATIWLVLLLRRRLGTVGTLCAAALLAVSPGAVYLSRYFIHETLFVFFTLGVVVAALKYYEDGHPVYLILAAVSAALLFATKETALISAGVLVIAFLSTHLYRWLRDKSTSASQPRPQQGSKRAEDPETPHAFIDRIGGSRALTIWAVAAIAVFIAVNVLFYSSFFTNYPQGIYDALKTFQFWTKTGKEAHVHSFATYVRWLFWQESPLLFLGTIGAAFVVWRPSNSFALFSALWAFGLIAAYSLIAYKTPWLTLNFIVPLALVSGQVFQVFYDRGPAQLRLLGVIGVVALGINGYQTIDLNFVNYDNDDPYYVYVYAHTRREILNLVKEIDRIAERSKEGDLMGITIVSADYWPLPWYLRDYTRVGYYGHMVDSTEPVIIASESQGAEVQSKFGDRYQQVGSGINPAGSYPLRPGVNLLLYARRGLAGP
jgi:uncharacterized protein (TIGR03663 family)